MSLDEMLGYVPLTQIDTVLHEGDQFKLHGTSVWMDVSLERVGVMTTGDLAEHYEPFAVEFRRPVSSKVGSVQAELGRLLGLGDKAVWQDIVNATRVLVMQLRQGRAVNEAACDAVAGGYSDGSGAVVLNGDGVNIEAFMRPEQGTVVHDTVVAADWVSRPAMPVPVSSSGKLYVDPVVVDPVKGGRVGQAAETNELEKLREFRRRIESVTKMP